ncbi:MULTISPECIES: hypothetical protein [Microbulbifer]|uniref:Lipoprotein n=1 Tax=Microbulbifer celer TaxID=435905 RepID=A0ABW3U5T6_9GAMM|nr:MULTISPECIES: hypothetical protein [Microbulbifer]UFN58416.1 hypothetical protein LPW13_05075 [Microbulbifer celer]
MAARDMGVYIRGIFAIVLLSTLWACDGRGGNSDVDPTPESGAESATPSADANGSGNDAASGAGGKGDAVSGTDKQEGKMAVQGDSNIWVQEARGDRQCEGGGKSLEQSGKHLAENGIKVQESRCGVRTDRMYPSVCGGATGNLLLHRIPASFLDSALQLGFDPAKTGKYEFSDCPSVPPSAPREY